MSYTKKFLAVLTLLLLQVYSCQKEDFTQTTDESDVVTDFLKLSSAVDSTCQKDSTDSLHHKHHINIVQIDLSTLPTSITTYIQTNYAGSSIQIAGVDSLGNYYIKIMKADSTTIGVLFNPSGQFVRELLHKKHRERGTEINVSSLPSAITTYIQTNYATSTIHKAILETNGSYRVILIQSDNTYLGLSFDTNGKFVTAVTVSDKHGKRKGRKH